MNIINFTPLSAFAGGIIIGLAVVVFFVGNGRLAGISSITDNLLTSKQGRGDNFLFLIGLVVGPIIFLFFTTNEIGPGVFDIHSPRVPSTQEMTNLLTKAIKNINKDKIWVNPDCGLKTRGWPETINALQNMVLAAKNLRRSLG